MDGLETRAEWVCNRNDVRIDSSAWGSVLSSVAWDRRGEEIWLGVSSYYPITIQELVFPFLSKCMDGGCFY